MKQPKNKRVLKLLAVGFDTEDEHIRITQSGNYDVMMGSDESHEVLQALCARIEAEIEKKGLILQDMTPEQLQELVQGLASE